MAENSRDGIGAGEKGNSRKDGKSFELLKVFDSGGKSFQELMEEALKYYLSKQARPGRDADPCVLARGTAAKHTAPVFI